MAEKPQGETMVVINGRAGKIILRDKRVLMPGGSAKVSVEEGKQLMKTPKIIDAAKAVPAQAEEAEALKKRIKDLESENAGLKKGKGGKAAPEKKEKEEPAKKDAGAGAAPAKDQASK